MMKELTPLLKIDVHRSQAIPEDAPHHSIRCYITSANSTTKRNDDDISEEAQRLLIHKSAVDDEFEHIVKLALPVIATTIIETFPSVVTFLFVGHIASPIAEEQIAAASLSILFLNVTGLSTAFGLASALDTLCSQAYGAGNAIRIGVYLQTGMIVLSIVFFVAWLLNFYISEILQLLGQPMAVAQLAGDFSRYLLPGVPFVYLYELLKRVLQAQNIASPMVYVAILANIISLSTGYYLCFHTSLGFLGAAVSKSLSIMCYPILLLPYMVSSGLMTPIWTGFQWKKAFEGVPEFLALGIPGMLQTCFEWWAFGIIALLCGILPDDPVAAIGSNASVLNISYLAWTLYGGLSGAANVRMGNALGAGSSVRAMVVWKESIFLAAIIAIMCSLFFLVFRTKLPAIFTNDKSINKLASSLLYVIAVFQIADAINSCVQGIFRGSGRQALGAKLNFVAYYAIGVPIGCILGFQFHLGVIGLWIGMSVGLFVTAIVGLKIVSETNWSQLILEAQKRTSRVGCEPLLQSYKQLDDNNKQSDFISS